MLTNTGVHDLSLRERRLLERVHRSLTILTRKHSLNCTCELCAASLNTFCEDESPEFWTVPGVLFSK